MCVGLYADELLLCLPFLSPLFILEDILVTSQTYTTNDTPYPTTDTTTTTTTTTTPPITTMTTSQQSSSPVGRSSQDNKRRSVRLDTSLLSIQHLFLQSTSCRLVSFHLPPSPSSSQPRPPPEHTADISSSHSPPCSPACKTTSAPKTSATTSAARA